MPINKKSFKIIIVSPSDVREERQTINESIKIVNEIFKNSNVIFEPYQWETDVYPSFHPEGPQGIIDGSLDIKNSDILIGIFYLRFGSPVKDSGSGTIHEIKQAIESLEEKGIPEIKLYFKKPITKDLEKLTKDDFEQFENVRNFKKEMYSKGIIGEFNKKDDFKNKLIKDLTIFILKKIGVIPDNSKKLKKEVIQVDNEIEFIKSIGSNREIILTPKKYDLSNFDYLRREPIFHEKVFDGKELIIKNIENLTIISNEEKSEILVCDTYANVLTFRDSSNIALKNVIFGHSNKPGECLGGVLKFEKCSNVIINDSILFGSGTEGLSLYNVDNFNFSNSTIKNCTQGIMSIAESRNVNFRNSFFENNQIALYGVAISDFSFVEFIDCKFIDNYSWDESDLIKNELISTSINSDVLIKNSQIIKNYVDSLIEEPRLLNLENVIIEGNKFNK
ncbi:MAG: right-handed parallel beta-helix repeat-containing protein [Candidatus Humimicrobiaceae bacterium]